MEYVGIVLVAAILVSSLAVTFTPLGKTYMAKLCEAFGAECSADDTGRSDDPPEIDCVQNTTETVASLGVNVFFLDQGSEVGIMTETLSDGTYRVTLVDGGSFGVSTGTGKVQAEVRVGDHGGVGGAGASAGIGLKGAVGTEYIFDSVEDLNDFYDWAAKEQAADLIGGMSPVAGWTAKRLTDLGNLITGNSYSPPKSTAQYYEGGVVISGEAMAGMGTGLSGDLSVSNTIGVRKDSVTNETTVYAKAGAEGSGRAYGGIGTISATGEVEDVFAMTFDSSGKLVSLRVEATMAGSADLSVIGIPKDEIPPASAGTRVVMELPVTDGNRTQVIESLNGVGVIKGIQDGSGPTAPFNWLMEEVARNGDLILQDIDVTNSNGVSIGLAAELPLVKGAGVSGSTGVNTTVVNRTQYLGRYGLMDMEGCGGTGSSSGDGRD